MLVIELKIGEAVKIGQATVRLEDKSGKVARLSIGADRSIPIQRLQPANMAEVAKGGLGSLAMA